MSVVFSQIAIDGPAGAGKSTVARILAQRLNFLYLDTGAMYRAITYKALRQGVDPKDGEALTDLAEHTEIEIETNENGSRLMLDGQDVTEYLRGPEIGAAVSLVAQVPGVRYRLVALQRQIAQNNNVVMDGRDIGSNVLPNATHKFFITASVEERARRRWLETCMSGMNLTLEQVEMEIRTRDSIDSRREVAPLTVCPDAVYIDTTGLEIEEVVAKMLAVLGESREGEK